MGVGSVWMMTVQQIHLFFRQPDNDWLMWSLNYTDINPFCTQ